MGFDPISTIVGAAATALNKIFPDADAKMKEKFALATLEIQTAAQAAMVQAETNKIEAQNPSLFIAGWRPMVGWVCVSGLAYSFLLCPLLTWLAGFIHKAGPPTLDAGPLLALLTALLGMGGLRTIEKAKGVETSVVKT